MTSTSQDKFDFQEHANVHLSYLLYNVSILFVTRFRCPALRSMRRIKLDREDYQEVACRQAALANTKLRI